MCGKNSASEIAVQRQLTTAAITGTLKNSASEIAVQRQPGLQRRNRSGRIALQRSRSSGNVVAAMEMAVSRIALQRSRSSGNWSFIHAMNFLE